MLRKSHFPALYFIICMPQSHKQEATFAAALLSNMPLLQGRFLPTTLILPLLFYLLNPQEEC